jgi:predicted metalloprotease
MDKVNRAGQSNEMSVRLELQADCYAGIYANYAQKKGLLDAGDAEEAIRAASAVGDDSIQRNTQGYVVPDSFTHGSSQQRIEWFARGFKSGDMRQCNTFGR